MKRRTLGYCAVALAAAALQAQTPLEKDIRDIVAASAPERLDLVNDLLGGELPFRQVVEAIEANAVAARDRAARAAASSPAAAARQGSRRMKTQTGNPALTAGSTSLVARTSATSFLSAAVESGAVSSKTDQGAATFSLNALPIAQILLQDGPPYGCGSIRRDRLRSAGLGVCEEGYGRWLRGLSGTASFNINSKETPVPVLSKLPGGALIADGLAVLQNNRTLSAMAVKYEIFHRETSVEKLADASSKAAKTLNESLEKTGLLGAASLAGNAMVNLPAYQAWKTEARKDLLANATGEPALRKAYDRQLELLLLVVAGNTELSASLRDLQKPMRDFEDSIAKEQAERTYRKGLSFDFVHQRPTDQPWLDKFRLDFNTPLGRKLENAGDEESVKREGAAVSLDFNAAFTVYHIAQTIDAKSKRLRDANASLALNWRLKPWGQLGSAIITLAGYYQYMFQNALIEFNSEAFTPGASQIPLRAAALEVLNTKGSVGIGQLRLEIR